MRITGGDLRGRMVPGSVRSGVRPTSSRVREALFSMVGQDLTDTRVLDAFGGSGLLSFEAYSRGATVTTVERHRATARQIQEAAQGLGAKIDLRTDDARNVLSAGSWELILMDPPYADDPVEWAAAAASATEETLVIEHRTGAVMPQSIGALQLDRSRRHGDSVLTIYRRRTDTGGDEALVVVDDQAVIEDDG
jgi:16S rRNA (guanine966-N2)-methyltransferase